MQKASILSLSSPPPLCLKLLIRSGPSSMQLSTELTPCACWTVWRWSLGRRGWRLPELFSTWLRVSPHHIEGFSMNWIRREWTKMREWMIFDQGGNFNFLFMFLSGKSCFLSRNLCRVQLWGRGAALDEIQHLSAAGCWDLLCSGGTAQHGDWVCSPSIKHNKLRHLL